VPGALTQGRRRPGRRRAPTCNLAYFSVPAHPLRALARPSKAHYYEACKGTLRRSLLSARPPRALRAFEPSSSVHDASRCVDARAPRGLARRRRRARLGGARGADALARRRWRHHARHRVERHVWRARLGGRREHLLRARGRLVLAHRRRCGARRRGRGLLFMRCGVAGRMTSAAAASSVGCAESRMLGERRFPS
jgi:hypothetical protein